MSLVKKKRKNTDKPEYDVYHKGVRVAHVTKGWMSPGGEQFIATMNNGAKIGNQSMKGLLGDIEKKL